MHFALPAKRFIAVRAGAAALFLTARAGAVDSAAIALPRLFPATPQVASCPRESLHVTLDTALPRIQVNAVYSIIAANPEQRDTVCIAAAAESTATVCSLFCNGRLLEKIHNSNADSARSGRIYWLMPDNEPARRTLRLSCECGLPAKDTTGPFELVVRYGGDSAQRWSGHAEYQSMRIQCRASENAQGAGSPLFAFNYICPHRTAVEFTADRVSWTNHGEIPPGGITLQLGDRWRRLLRPDAPDFKKRLCIDSQRHASYVTVAGRYQRYVSTPFMIDQYLDALEADQLYFLRLFVYAIHGYSFQNQSITDYFQKLQDAVQVQGRRQDWYREALERGYQEPEPYIAGLIETMKELQCEKAGFPHYDAEYGWIIFNYENFLRYPEQVQSRFLAALSFDELFFMYHQLSARNGYRFNIQKLQAFFERWEQESQAAGFDLWYTESLNRGYNGLGPELKAIAGKIERRLDLMIE